MGGSTSWVSAVAIFVTFHLFAVLEASRPARLELGNGRNRRGQKEGPGLIVNLGDHMMLVIEDSSDKSKNQETDCLASVKTSPTFGPFAGGWYVTCGTDNGIIFSKGNLVCRSMGPDEFQSLVDQGQKSGEEDNSMGAEELVNALVTGKVLSEQNCGAA
eukprot:TRINITY_DN28929_c0_g1_i1.p2 TRINITY_DN28929_c0_g1~~TRINITY_DN28929_c0_g1_i1.p2  ORF type:complete len:159 (+),score=20.62 TRINITY_DN28929_c0_g1_i1:54-530(+)